MKWQTGILCAGLAVSGPAVAQAAPIPKPVKNMIRAAAGSGDPALLASTAKLAKKANPDSAAEIDALVKQLKADAARRHKEELEREGFFDGWSGEGQVGLSNSTGNTRNTGISLGLSFERNGLQWRHAFNATVDYSRNNGVVDKDRYFASWESDYKFSKRAYAVGLTSWESDRFSGFHSRISESLGLGYALVRTDDMKLSIQGGPALRQTDYISGGTKNRFSGMAAVKYKWTILPGLLLSENATFYGDNHDSTLTSNSALTTKLIGALSAQASFFVQYESNPPADLVTTNTLSRVTLVYSF